MGLLALSVGIGYGWRVDARSSEVKSRSPPSRGHEQLSLGLFRRIDARRAGPVDATRPSGPERLVNSSR